MNAKDISTSSSSCFWISDGKEIRLKSPYPDRYSVSSEETCYPSSKEYILDSKEDEQGTDNYLLRCFLFKHCANRIESSIQYEIKHTTDKCIYLIKQFLACISKNYNESRVLPICLVLLDSQTYKHEKKDPFELGLYCSMTLHHEFLEIDELTGYDQVKEEIEREKGKYETKQLDVYLYQSEFHKNQNMKEIIEYCLSCRINHNQKINLIVEWNCFPEEFGNLLQRAITANCYIQPILFPSTLQLLNNAFDQLIIQHQLPFSFPSSFLTTINATLINYDFSIWSWAKSLEYYAWNYFSYQPWSVLCQEMLKLFPNEGERSVGQRLSDQERSVSQGVSDQERSATHQPISNQKEESNTHHQPVPKQEGKKRPAKRQPAENRYELRKKKKLTNRHEFTSKEEEIINTNVVKCLSDISIPALRHCLTQKSLQYDEAKLKEMLRTLHTYWDIQFVFIQLFTKIATSLVGSFSHRELYCQFIAEKRSSSMDVFVRFQKALKQLQDVRLFEDMLDDLTEFVDFSMTRLPTAYSTVKKLLEDCLQTYQESKTETPTSVANRMEQLKRIHNREELKKQLQKQEDEHANLKQKVKDAFLAVITHIVTVLFHGKNYLSLNSLFLVTDPPKRSSLTLSNRRRVIEGIYYPSTYYQCSCCKNGEITAKYDDITILYNLFISLGKVIDVKDLRKQFHSYFAEEKEVTEARFWDSLTTLQYLGFLELNNNEEKIMKLDFAL